MIQARIEADTVSPAGSRITTFVLTYPRFIHSELMTHRVFSRNAASSRAIPFDRMVRMVRENPAMPVKWGSHQPGMQSGDEVDAIARDRAIEVWSHACREAIAHAGALDTLGVHKSISNRLLEPFAHMTTLVTATDWENFFHLRANPAAQPEFQELAYEMLEAYLANTPRTAHAHVPFGDDAPAGSAFKVATARCARVSYLRFANDSDLEADIALHDRLAANGHWSPFEHCATALGNKYERSGNFRGWKQYRKSFHDECATNVDLHSLRRTVHA